MSTYNLRDAARILRVSPARLRYWERTNLLHPERAAEPAPSLPEATQDPSLFDFRDLVCVRGILGLLEQGVPLRRIRRNIELLRDRVPEIDDPIRSLRLWVEGSERVVVRHDGMLIEPDGQMVLDFGGGPPDAPHVSEIATGPQAGRPSLSPTDEAEACFVRGCQLDGDAETFSEAVDFYMRGIALDPDFADCHCNLGAVHYNRGDRAQARRCFERCLEIESHHVEANFNLANLLEEEGSDARALHHYRLALAADPLYPDLHINLALLCEKVGDGSQARRHWRRYLQLDADGAWAEVARRRLESGEEA